MNDQQKESFDLTAPYADFPGNQTVAQSLCPYPQFANIPVSGDPRGKTWYVSPGDAYEAAA